MIERVGNWETKFDVFCKLHQTNLKAVCESSGVKYPTLHGQIHNRRPIPFETIDSICKQFGMSTDYFSDNRTDQPDFAADVSLEQLSGNLVDQVAQVAKLNQLSAGRKLNAHDIALLHYKHGGQYECLEPYIEQVDVYRCPKPDVVRMVLHRMGSESLTTRTFRVQDSEKLQASLDNAPLDFIKRYVDDHRRAANGEKLFTFEQLDTMASEHSERVRLDYFRLLIRFDSTEHGPLIVNHSELLR